MPDRNPLVDAYKAASATEQAGLLAAIVAQYDSNGAPLTALAPLMDPRAPRCPACGLLINDCAAVNVSMQYTDVTIYGSAVIDEPAGQADYHVTHYVTSCCNVAINFGTDFTVTVG